MATVVLLGLVSCSGDDDGAVAVATTEGAGTTGSSERTDPTTAGPGTTAGSATTVEVAETVLLGSLVGRNAGGEGPDQTVTDSPLVKYDTGQCEGWDGRRDGGWTAGVVDGATITVFDADTGEEIATGTLPATAAEDVSGGDGQWQCTFTFAIRDVPVVDRYAIDVGGLGPFALEPDPAQEGQWITGLELPTVPPDVCQDVGGDVVADLDPDLIVGQWWQDAANNLCTSGLAWNGDVERACRPQGLAIDSVVAVVLEDGTLVVDASGTTGAASGLEVGTPVRLVLTAAVPCTD